VDRAGAYGGDQVQGLRGILRARCRTPATPCRRARCSRASIRARRAIAWTRPRAQWNAARARRTNARSQLERGSKLLENAWINPATTTSWCSMRPRRSPRSSPRRWPSRTPHRARRHRGARPGRGHDPEQARRAWAGHLLADPGRGRRHAAHDHGRPRPRASPHAGGRDPISQARARHGGPHQRRRRSREALRGTIEKIEPQATVEQNVTLFPVLISLRTRNTCSAGMNVEARFDVARRDDVLTVPVTALRTERDIATTAASSARRGCGPQPARRGRPSRTSRASVAPRAKAPRACAAASGWSPTARARSSPCPWPPGSPTSTASKSRVDSAKGTWCWSCRARACSRRQERLQNFHARPKRHPGITQPAQPSQDGARRRGRPSCAARAAERGREGGHARAPEGRLRLHPAATCSPCRAHTMLGVIIGWRPSITMRALGTGAQRAVEQQLRPVGGTSSP